MTKKIFPLERTSRSGKLTEPPTKLGERLREIRISSGLNQGQVGELINPSGKGNKGGRVSSWELGRHIPSLDILIRYSEIFNTTVSKILDGVM